MDLIQQFYIFMTALFSALIMVPALRRWALDTGAVDVPDERKVHREAVPRIGGIAVFMAFLFSILVYVEMTREIRGLAAGVLIVFFTGLIDDLYGLKARWKFLGQAAGCLVAVTVGGVYLSRLGDLFGLGPIVLPLWLAVPFTVFAVVGVINAINLIDGLDGLAGGVSAIALAVFFLLAHHDGNASVMALCAALLGGVLGFLKYNAFPARIFMGDTGSLTVGFLLAFLAIHLTQAPAANISPVVPLLVLGLPIMDTVWVMTRRALQRLSPFTPDKTHVHHKFLDLGFQHRFTVIIIYGISLFWAVFALALRGVPEYVLFAVYLLTSALCYLGLHCLSRHRERFSLLARDSAQGLRKSSLYLRIAEWCHFAVPALKGVILFYLVAAAYFYNDYNEAGAVVIQFSLLIFLASLGLLYLTRDTGNHFLLALLYAAALMIVFQAEQFGSRPFGWGLSVGDVSNALFVLAAVLVALKVIFRMPGELFLTTPLDFLILAMSISVAVVSPEMNLAYSLSGAVSKAIILFLAFKVVAGREKGSAKLVFGAVQVALLTIIVQGVW